MKDKEPKQKDKSSKDGGKSDKLERRAPSGKISMPQDVDTEDATIIDQLKLQRRGPSSFEKIKLIGKGGVGRVYLVRLQETGQLFAMKVLKKSEMISRNKVFLALLSFLPFLRNCNLVEDACSYLFWLFLRLIFALGREPAQVFPDLGRVSAGGIFGPPL